MILSIHCEGKHDLNARSLFPGIYDTWFHLELDAKVIEIHEHTSPGAMFLHDNVSLCHIYLCLVDRTVFLGAGLVP